jgi:hypothetical protein
VDFASDNLCNIVVYLMNPRTWGDSARALFRHALPADTSVLSREYCGGRPEVHVRASRYASAELSALANRITTMLREPSLKVRGSIRVTPETLIVGAYNQAALKRARSRLAREKKLPRAITCDTATVVSFEPPRQFVDGRYAFSVSWRSNDYYYEVDCSSGVCRVRMAAQLPGDKLAGYPSAEFPNIRSMWLRS